MNREDLLYAIEEEASYQKLIDVLCAVVELHIEHGECSTIQIIQKELK